MSVTEAVSEIRRSVARCACLSTASVVGAAAVAIAAPSAPSAVRYDSPAYELSATALVMGGTGVPLIVPGDTPEFITSFVESTFDDHITPAEMCIGGDPGCTLVAVNTPQQLSPLVGTMPFGESVEVGRQILDNCIRGAQCTAALSPYANTGPTVLTDSSYVAVGESQSSVLSSYQKAYLIDNPAVGKTVSFILLSNQNRPNGGILQRFVGAYLPIVDIAFNGATPTNSSRSAPLITVDNASQYDGWADFPTNPGNLLATANAFMGAAFLHHLFRHFDGFPQLQGQYQDTTYYLQPAAILPLLEPLTLVPVIGIPLAKALDPPLRVLVETGYDRTINPGQPTAANFSYFPDPVKTLTNLAIAVPTGWDDAISFITDDDANRPFGTTPQPVYGVGGPPVNAGAIDPYGPATPAPISEESVDPDPFDGISVYPDPTAAERVVVRANPRPKAPRAAAASVRSDNPDAASGSNSSKRTPALRSRGKR